MRYVLTNCELSDGIGYLYTTHNSGGFSFYSIHNWLGYGVGFNPDGGKGRGEDDGAGFDSSNGYGWSVRTGFEP